MRTPNEFFFETFLEPRSIFEDFPDCGFKGSSTRVIGGENILENEYPWLCSLKYRDSHICGMTLLSGPPHDTILVRDISIRRIFIIKLFLHHFMKKS